MIEAVRDKVKTILDQGRFKNRRDNLSLIFNRLCTGIDEPRPKKNGRKKTECKEAALDALRKGYHGDDYWQLIKFAHNSWQNFLDDCPDTLCFEMETSSPLIVGLGDQNAHEFGITLQPPWGTPVIPGSAVKGVVSTFASEYGDATWYKSKASEANGEFARLIFGGLNESGQGEAGGVDFLDARWVPPCQKESPFAEDIINVHYPSYYGEELFEGKKAVIWPYSLENPVPNKFVVIKPGQKFLFAVRCPDRWSAEVWEILVLAAKQRGFGAKTRTGYGRLTPSRCLTELVETMPFLNNEKLADLYETHKGCVEMSDAFAREVYRREIEPALETFYEKYRPAVLLLAELRAKKPQGSKAVGKVCRKYKGVLQSAAQAGTSDDFGEIDYICQRQQYELRGTWLWNLALASVTETIKGWSAEEIYMGLDNREQAWPPLESFVEALEDAKISDDDKEICREVLRERLDNEST